MNALITDKPFITKETSLKISLLNFVGCLLVLGIHSTGYKYFPEAGTASRVLIDLVTGTNVDASVCVFFVLSGALFFINTPKDSSEQKTFFLKQWKKRVFSLLIPYFLWNIIWMAGVAVITMIPVLRGYMDNFGLFELTWDSICKGIFLYKYNGVFWYIQYLMVYVLLSPLIYYILKNTVVGTVFLAVTFWQSGISRAYLISSVYYSLFMFTLGAYIVLHFPKILNFRLKKDKAMIAAICLIGLCLLMEWYSPTVYLREAMKALFVGLLWISLDVWESPKIYWWMKCTFFVYAFHRIPQQCINKIFSLVLPKSAGIAGLSAFLNTVLGMVLTYALAVICAAIIKKMMPKVWFVLNGGR